MTIDILPDDIFEENGETVGTWQSGVISRAPRRHGATVLGTEKVIIPHHLKDTINRAKASNQAVRVTYTEALGRQIADEVRII